MSFPPGPVAALTECYIIVSEVPDSRISAAKCPVTGNQLPRQKGIFAGRNDVMHSLCFHYLIKQFMLQKVLVNEIPDSGIFEFLIV